MKDTKKLTISKDRKTKGLSSISNSILPFAKQILGKKGFVEIDILTNWETIIGKELSAYTLPQRIDFKKDQRNNGILHLEVPAGAFAVEVKHKENLILERINAYFGYNAVSSLKIIQNNSLSIADTKTPAKQNKSLVSPEEENYIKSLGEDIENPRLKEILTKLGLNIKATQPKKEEF